MKTIIASAAVAVASLGVAGVASAQGINIVSPYVGIEHVTRPFWDDKGTNNDSDDEWARFGDDERNYTELTAGTEVYLPYNLELDAGVTFTNEGGELIEFGFGGADVTLSYEFANGLELYTTTEWGMQEGRRAGDPDALTRESTSVGAIWKF